MHKPHSWINIRSIVQAKKKNKKQQKTKQNIKLINEVLDNHLHMHLLIRRSG